MHPHTEIDGARVVYKAGLRLFCLSLPVVYVYAEPETECYNSRGTSYRGAVGTTVSGARCLPWNSDLLFDELHVGTVAASALRGLGEHAYCRSVCAETSSLVAAILNQNGLLKTLVFDKQPTGLSGNPGFLKLFFLL